MGAQVHLSNWLLTAVFETTKYQAKNIIARIYMARYSPDMGHSSKYPTLPVAVHNPNDEYNGW